MTKNYDALADKWVHVGPASSPIPTRKEIISRLEEKTLIFSLTELKKYL
jgi:hypothetical protein